MDALSALSLMAQMARNVMVSTVCNKICNLHIVLRTSEIVLTDYLSQKLAMALTQTAFLVEVVTD